MIVPAAICGGHLFTARQSNVGSMWVMNGVRMGGFFMNVFPFITQMITLIFTSIKVGVYLAPFRSRYAITLGKTVISIILSYVINIALECLLFSPDYDFRYNPCTGIIHVVIGSPNVIHLYYAWIKMLLSLLPFALTILGNFMLGVAVAKARRSKLLITSDRDKGMTETQRRTLTTAFLLTITNVIGYSLQNSVLFYYLIRYPRPVRNVTKYPSYERILADLLLPTANAATNSILYIFHYLPTLTKLQRENTNRSTVKDEANSKDKKSSDGRSSVLGGLRDVTRRKTTDERLSLTVVTDTSTSCGIDCSKTTTC